MKRKTMILLLSLALAAGMAGGCASSDSSDDLSKFVGLWRMSLVGDPGDPGLDWRFNSDQATIVLYETRSTSPKGGGTCTIIGKSASGGWSVGAANSGRFTATLTSDTTMDFNFIEDNYAPPKTLVYIGTRLE